MVSIVADLLKSGIDFMDHVSAFPTRSHVGPCATRYWVTDISLEVTINNGCCALVESSSDDEHVIIPTSRLLAENVGKP